MQPIKITILGDYYDCQIYRGRLYLWTFEGVLKVYNWKSLVESLIKEETDKIAMTFCFLDGNYLYKSSLIELFKDSDFKNLLLKKFKNIEQIEFCISEKEMSNFLFGEQNTPTDILPTDTEIYSNKLYFITEKGLFSSSAHRDKSEKYPVSSKPKKMWDCNLLSIKANKYPQLALSGGDEGLFELNMAQNQASNLKRIEKSAPIFKISDEHSSFSNYSYINIYNTSLTHNSFLATFKWNTKVNRNKKDVYLRDFDSKIFDKQIFLTSTKRKKEHFISWGIEDKIYKAIEGGFEIIKYNARANEQNGEEKFTRMQTVDLHAWKGKVINGGTAYFGNIVECENALVITQSNKEVLTIPGPITRWRVYPRSLNYENHLHVVLNDRVEIYSFNHDYFLNQNNKELGIQFAQSKRANKWSSKKSYFEDTDETFFDQFDNELKIPTQNVSKISDEDLPF